MNGASQTPLHCKTKQEAKLSLG